MKITVLSENLKKGLGIVGRGISTRPQLPILSGVLLRVTNEGLQLISTDLEISFWVKVGAKVTEEGEIVMPAKLLFDLVNSLPAGPVEMVSEKEKLQIVAGTIKAEMLGQSPEDFPVIPKSKNVQAVIGTGEFRETVEKVSVSSARDDTRPILTGVLWQFGEEGVVLAATDGYRLSVDRLALKKAYGGKETKVILPAKSLTEVAKVIAETGDNTVGLEFDKENQQVIFVLDEVEISSRLIAGEFPPYQQIMPNTYKTKITFSRDDFSDAVKRAKLFARENANIVKLEIGDGKMIIRAESSQIGTNMTEIEAEIEGEGLVVAFNAQYLLDYLNICVEKEIVWETEGELKPSKFLTDDADWVQVIMPVRVQS